jgi:hypothetical protein
MKAAQKKENEKNLIKLAAAHEKRKSVSRRGIKINCKAKRGKEKKKK